MPLWSVTVTTTVFGPTLAQPNEVWLAEKATIWQLSVGRLLGGVGRTTCPAPLSTTVKFWQLIVGGIKSRTATEEAQVLLFPFTSVTVNTTVFNPRLRQLKLEMFNVVAAMPQLSVLPLLTAVADVVTMPDALRLKDKF